MSERRCPKCASVYPESARFCPRDGTMLVEGHAKGSPAAAPAGGDTAVRTPRTPRSGRGLDRAPTLSGQILDMCHQVMKKLGEGGLPQVVARRAVAPAAEGAPNSPWPT